MPFNNPIVGGVTLRIPAIQSVNYVPQTSGWALFKNGNIEVNDGTFRGDVSIGNPPTDGGFIGSTIPTVLQTYLTARYSSISDFVILAYGQPGDYLFISTGVPNSDPTAIQTFIGMVIGTRVDVMTSYTSNGGSTVFNHSNELCDGSLLNGIANWKFGFPIPPQSPATHFANNTMGIYQADVQFGLPPGQPFGDDTGSVTLNTPVTINNIVSNAYRYVGTVSIVPVANVKSSATITFPVPLLGTKFNVQVSFNSAAVSGSTPAVSFISYSSVSSTGVTVNMIRNDTTQTSVSVTVEGFN